MQDATAIEGIECRYRALAGLMDERMRRQWAAAEAKSYGWGGLRAVSRATGLSPNTIAKGFAELHAREAHPQVPYAARLRKPGAGRKRATVVDPELAAALERLVDPVPRGDPQSLLRWTCKSTTQLADELTRRQHPVSPRTVGRLLRANEYSLQSNRKTKEGKNHPDRNAQFEQQLQGNLAHCQQPSIQISRLRKAQKQCIEHLCKGRGSVAGLRDAITGLHGAGLTEMAEYLEGKAVDAGRLEAGTIGVELPYWGQSHSGIDVVDNPFASKGNRSRSAAKRICRNRDLGLARSWVSRYILV